MSSARPEDTATKSISQTHTQVNGDVKPKKGKAGHWNEKKKKKKWNRPRYRVQCEAWRGLDDCSVEEDTWHVT